MKRLLYTHPFLLLGLVTLGLFLFVNERADITSNATIVDLLIPVLRVLVIPMLLIHYAEIALGLPHWPSAVYLAVGIPLLFTPYVFADLFWRRLRGR